MGAMEERWEENWRERPPRPVCLEEPLQLQLQPGLLSLVLPGPQLSAAGQPPVQALVLSPQPVPRSLQLPVK